MFASDYTFDLPSFNEIFSLRQFSFDKFPYDTVFRYGPIDGPRRIALIEQFRELAKSDLGPSLPVDIFIFGRGEPQDRSITKVGGLPYRPASKTWPIGKSGRPLDFLAQFSFDDLIPGLPGEVLVVFCDGPELDSDDIVCEWYDRSLAPHELVVADAVPSPYWVQTNLHGYRHRTRDFIDVQQVQQILSNELPNYNPLRAPNKTACLQGVCQRCLPRIAGANEVGSSTCCDST